MDINKAVLKKFDFLSLNDYTDLISENNLYIKSDDQWMSFDIGESEELVVEFSIEVYGKYTEDYGDWVTPSTSSVDITEQEVKIEKLYIGADPIPLNSYDNDSLINLILKNLS